MEQNLMRFSSQFCNANDSMFCIFHFSQRQYNQIRNLETYKNIDFYRLSLGNEDKLRRAEIQAIIDFQIKYHPSTPQI